MNHEWWALAKYLCIGVVETWVWTADKQPVALLAKNDRAVQVIPQQAISDKGNKGHTGALYSKNMVLRRQGQELGWHFLLFATYYGVSDQLRDQRGQRRPYWPPFAPWVQ
jgi:hypothetical protein